jgi:hypothetical protein
MDHAIEARATAADEYDAQWPLRTTIGNLAREGFLAGWDAAMAHAKERDNELTQMLADGRYCRHRDDDSAHNAGCYRQTL